MLNDKEIGKFIVFKIANYRLALPINKVLKIVSFSPEANRDLSTMGLVQLGRHTIKLLDFHQDLYGKSRNFTALLTGDSPPESKKQQFLVIVRKSPGEFCGILVDEPPDLMEFPQEIIRTLPQSEKRGKGILSMVSHAAIISQEKLTTTIFILDVQRVVDSEIIDSRLPALKSSGG
jgi:purine-binding chemotaxis protein CheW